MAELDYAFIAEYATAENGKLTVVGASYISVEAATFPAVHLLSVAGRVRAPEGTEAVELGFTVTSPAPSVPITASGVLTPDETTAVYDGKIGIVFAMSTMIQVTAPGLVEVDIEVDGAAARHLAFEVKHTS
ncbi:DUF6941 family protein [Nocardia sp. NPDC003979]